MKPTWRPLEFVTIANPGEIKDPEKQRVIRRQARRRDTGSKLRSRKPFKVVIDLPCNDIHASPERPIIGGQEVGSYYILPSGHDDSELNTMSPSFGSLRSSSSGNGLILTSPSITKFNDRAANLVNFLHGKSNRHFCPLIDFWWSVGQLDSTAFLITLANATRLISRGQSSEPKQGIEAIALYTNSVRLLQKRLQTPVDGISEGVVVSILEFAYYDFLVQDLARWLVHMGGLANVIKRRGGIKTLYSSEMILLLSFWIDISGSFIFDCMPFFPLPHKILTHVANKVQPSPTLERWTACSPELSDITTFLYSAADLSYYIDERAVGVEIWKDDLFVSKTFNAVVHQLLSLQRYPEAMEKAKCSPQLIMREAMRLACMVLFGLLREKFSVQPSGFSKQRDRLKEFLIQHRTGQSDFLELHLWVLLIAVLAAKDHETSWYIDEIKSTMAQMGISEWNDGVEVARNILWMDNTFRTRSEMVKDMINSMSTL